MKKITITLFTLLTLSQLAFGQYSTDKAEFFFGKRDASSGTYSGILGLAHNLNDPVANAYADYLLNTFKDDFSVEMPEKITYSFPSPFRRGTRTKVIWVHSRISTIKDSNVSIKDRLYAMYYLFSGLDVAKRASSFTVTNMSIQSYDELLNDVFGNDWFNQTFYDFQEIGYTKDYSSVFSKYGLIINNPIPLDGGLSFLLASGLGLGIFRRFKNKK